jgi:hypothetical protein
MRNLFFVTLFVLLAGCATTGPNPLDVEYQAYVYLLKEQHDKGNLTTAEVYQLAQAKANQLYARQAAAQAAGAASAGLGLMILQQNQPFYMPPVRCQSFQQGAFTNTTCQ